MAQEIELKFLIESGGLPMLDALPVIGKRLRRTPRKHIETTYFDTSDRRFTDNGFALRVRKQDKNALLSIKQAGSLGLGREEWERPITGDEPNAHDMSDSPAASLLQGNGSDAQLSPLYTVAVDRASFLVKEGSAQIEIAVDRGEIKRNGAELPVCELELELKKGDPRQLFALAQRFIDKAPLRLSLVSKGDRGDRLVDGSWGRPVGASTPKLNATMTAAQAFRTICHSCLYDFMLNEPAVEEDGDIEGVHRARIAVRRLRAALTLFRPMVDDRDFDRLRRELNWLSDLLGAARDLDVMQVETFEPQVHAGSAPLGATSLLAEVGKRRKEARRTLQAALHSDRMRKLLFDLVRWLDHGEWQARAEAQDPVLTRANELLARRFKQLRQRARHLTEADAKTRHRIRITAKKLRYMSEFFDNLVVGGKRRSRYRTLVRSLERIQAALGEMQDGEARAQFLQTLVTNMAGDEPASRAAITAFAAGVFTAVERPKEKKLLRKAEKAFAKIAETKPFLKAA
ncbi:CYTH and CHAD domain-containing protein [Taklimakanibacter deserti]|uniref:CYTH and CHAD domain-containing protein n=1 Tax=Taklimakanibacter deserti TaxID=2267839 RepID=UPI000E6557C5